MRHRILGSEGTREALKDLIEGRLSSGYDHGELVKLATRQVRSAALWVGATKRTAPRLSPRTMRTHIRPRPFWSAGRYHPTTQGKVKRANHEENAPPRVRCSAQSTRLKKT